MTTNLELLNKLHRIENTVEAMCFLNLVMVLTVFTHIIVHK